MAPAAPLESVTENYCRELATDHDCLLIKLQHGVVGMPDRLLVRPFLRDIFMEFKRVGEKPTKIQTYWHGQLRKKGKLVALVYTTAQFRRLLTS